VVPARHVGPAELYEEVAPLLAEGPAGEEALSRLARLLQEDPALLDLRFQPAAAARLSDELAVLDDAARERHTAHALPALVPPRLGRDALAAFERVGARTSDPLARGALALGRYFALLDDSEGAAAAGKNPLWHLLFELTLAELPEASPRPDPLALEAGPPAPSTPRTPPRLDAALRLAVEAGLEEPRPAARSA